MALTPFNDVGTGSLIHQLQAFRLEEAKVVCAELTCRVPKMSDSDVKSLAGALLVALETPFTLEKHFPQYQALATLLCVFCDCQARIGLVPQQWKRSILTASSVSMSLHADVLPIVGHEDLLRNMSLALAALLESSEPFVVGRFAAVLGSHERAAACWLVGVAFKLANVAVDMSQRRNSRLLVERLVDTSAMSRSMSSCIAMSEQAAQSLQPLSQKITELLAARENLSALSERAATELALREVAASRAQRAARWARWHALAPAVRVRADRAAARTANAVVNVRFAVSECVDHQGVVEWALDRTNESARATKNALAYIDKTVRKIAELESHIMLDVASIGATRNKELMLAASCNMLSTEAFNFAPAVRAECPNKLARSGDGSLNFLHQWVVIMDTFIVKELHLPIDVPTVIKHLVGARCFSEISPAFQGLLEPFRAEWDYLLAEVAKLHSSS